MVGESETKRPLLQVSDLEVELGSPAVKAVRKISFNIGPGEIIGLAGESGSGKSVTALSLTRLLPVQAKPVIKGDVILDRTSGNLTTLSRRNLRTIRGSRIAYIFQEPSASFNPVFTIGDHLFEILKLHGTPKNERQTRIKEAFEAVGINPDESSLRAYPGSFSGGMLQRTALACALLGDPELLIADEPTTALDTSTQKRVVDLLAKLNRERGMAILFISHDLGLIHQIASRILVMHEGVIVEEGSAAEVLEKPSHPYTRNLVSSIPRLKLPG